MVDGVAQSEEPAAADESEQLETSAPGSVDAYDASVDFSFSSKKKKKRNMLVVDDVDDKKQGLQISCPLKSHLLLTNLHLKDCMLRCL